ncbi:hypothetical protein MPTK1_8g01810 [Marchantia polymorpha subsp. ruderalis]|uniref:Uncharacterized protein n=1 Tax=Marchantia polymorpha TaxID=3197 RepID=A0A2R6WR28_MARPO|nr:hypothetical protein MARPO_0064s0019 [Marchantia polymorpha]BBN18346.1 hypothetical protein Mp_8g01810 [Marchantia polymorpha subsp. ruderalis]|eukprot:PTQ36327.1 hypothetical protein MARPO_0064s0019 [Marchantia polymorpha]
MYYTIKRVKYVKISELSKSNAAYTTKQDQPMSLHHLGSIRCKGSFALAPILSRTNAASTDVTTSTRRMGEFVHQSFHAPYFYGYK